MNAYKRKWFKFPQIRPIRWMSIHLIDMAQLHTRSKAHTKYKNCYRKMWRQSRFGNGRLKCALADMFSRLKPLDPKWTPLHVRWVWFFIDFRNSRMKIMNSLNGIAFSISINRCDTGSMTLLSSSLVSVKLVGIKFSGRLENDVEKKLSSSILKGFSPPPLAKESETPTRTARR